MSNRKIIVNEINAEINRNIASAMSSSLVIADFLTLLKRFIINLIEEEQIYPYALILTNLR